MTYARENKADKKHYWLTPPEIYEKLNNEFHFDFDPCPYPKPENFNGLDIEWGRMNYVNPPFRKIDGGGFGPTSFVHKAIEEYKKGKGSVILIPVQSYVNLLIEAGAELRSMDRVHWLEVDTKNPCKSPSPICCFILKPDNLNESNMKNGAIKKITTKSRPDGKSYNCTSCGLYKDCITKRMQPYGEFKKGIFICGESPGETEDKTGKPFQGRTGQLLQRTFRRLGINLFEDCIITNSVQCRPEDNETPTNFQIECCRKRVLQVIEEYKPKVIILLGNSAVYSLIGYRWKKDLGGITKWRGFTIPDQDFQCWICPTFHPSYVERSTDGAEETVWRNDLKQAFELLEIVNHPFPVYKKPEISIIIDLTRLDQIKEVFAIDFETTGLKPHAKGQRIVSCAIATDEDHALAFMLPKTRDEIYPLVRLLEDPHVAKYGQNCKFETAWAEVRLKANIKNWVWDTMLASHIYDNRQGITGLKFQTLVNFGIWDYSSDIEPYLKAVDNKNANALNRIIELISTEEGKEKLLTYNAYDAINTYRLAILQRNQLSPF